MFFFPTFEPHAPTEPQWFPRHRPADEQESILDALERQEEARRHRIRTIVGAPARPPLGKPPSDAAASAPEGGPTSTIGTPSGAATPGGGGHRLRRYYPPHPIPGGDDGATTTTTANDDVARYSATPASFRATPSAAASASSSRHPFPSTATQSRRTVSYSRRNYRGSTPGSTPRSTHRSYSSSSRAPSSIAASGSTAGGTGSSAAASPFATSPFFHGGGRSPSVWSPAYSQRTQERSRVEEEEEQPSRRSRRRGWDQVDNDFDDDGDSHRGGVDTNAETN